MISANAVDPRAIAAAANPIQLSNSAADTSPHSRGAIRPGFA
jgi:hypothetical protein